MNELPGKYGSKMLSCAVMSAENCGEKMVASVVRLIRRCPDGATPPANRKLIHFAMSPVVDLPHSSTGVAYTMVTMRDGDREREEGERERASE